MIAGGKRWIAYGSRSDKLKLYNLADLHVLNKGCEMTRLQADIAEIRDDPNAFWFGGGDNADLISHHDRRFDPATFSSDVRVQQLGSLGHQAMAIVRGLFEPIKGKCLGIMEGNHEHTYGKMSGQQGLVNWLCVELGVPYLGYSCFFDIIFVRSPGVKQPKLIEESPRAGKTRWRIRVFAHHGAGAAQTPGGKLNRLIQFMDYFKADLIFVAHIHDQLAKRIPRLGADSSCARLKEQVQLGLVTGSYLRSYAEGAAGYEEVAGWRPVPLGALCVQFTPDKKEMRAIV